MKSVKTAILIKLISVIMEHMSSCLPSSLPLSISSVNVVDASKLLVMSEMRLKILRAVVF